MEVEYRELLALRGCVGGIHSGLSGPSELHVYLAGSAEQ